MKLDNIRFSEGENEALTALAESELKLAVITKFMREVKT
jgi:hypothetical protein